eukprot:5303976-Amphidinium_carterae.1
MLQCAPPTLSARQDQFGSKAVGDQLSFRRALVSALQRCPSASRGYRRLCQHMMPHDLGCSRLEGPRAKLTKPQRELTDELCVQHDFPLSCCVNVPAATTS